MEKTGRGLRHKICVNRSRDENISIWRKQKEVGLRWTGEILNGCRQLSLLLGYSNKASHTVTVWLYLS